MIQGRVVPSVAQQLAIGIGGGGWFARWVGRSGRGEGGGEGEGNVGVSGEVEMVVVVVVVEGARWEMVTRRRKRLRRLRRSIFGEGEDGVVWCG